MSAHTAENDAPVVTAWPFSVTKGTFFAVASWRGQEAECAHAHKTEALALACGERLAKRLIPPGSTHEGTS